uniref:AAA+ ATPase domain-containing protein n=1 Tax=Alexandrium monilatum TaxID=311494 RepID=A0A7S4T3Q8_9DINO
MAWRRCLGAPARGARGVAYKVGPLSRISAAAAGRLIQAFAGRPELRQGQDRSPTAQTAVAAAARSVGSRGPSLAGATVGPPVGAAEWAAADGALAAGRLGALPPETAKAACGGPGALHEHLVSSGRLQSDVAQKEVLAELSRVFEGCACAGAGPRPQGVYLYGPVGTGKTLLLDIFLASLRQGLPHLRTHRAHLHDFLRAVHAELHRKRQLEPVSLHGAVAGDGLSRAPSAWPLGFTESDDDSYGGQSPFFNVLPARWWLLGEEDDRGRRRTGMAAGWVHASRCGGTATSVESLGRALAAKLDVLCFDEVAITTIQDCVVLGPLLRALCRRGVVLVATSNRAPNELYTGGLNRHVHLPPLVDAIRGHCRLHRIASEADHRMRIATSDGPASPAVALWRCAEGSSEGGAFLDAWWEQATGSSPLSGELRPVAVGYGRKLPVVQSRCGTCARFRFEDLCASALGACDFAELCGHFPALLVDGVPRLRAGAHSEAQRWIWLLDCCYELRTQLVLTSAADGPADLVDLHSVAAVGAGGGRSLQEVSFAVARANSRLHEMQTMAFQRACAERRSEAARAE